MRIVFIGRDNRFNRRIASELAGEHKLLACLWVEPDRFTARGRWQRIRRRWKRYGARKVVDELAFHVFDRLVLRRGERPLFARFPQYFSAFQALACPEFVARKVNARRWLEKLEQWQPDAIFSVCCATIFGERLCQIPRLGLFILHECLTPEYRGLHTPLWALMRREPQFLGFTVLKAGKQIDGGEVLLQRRYVPGAGESYRTWAWVGHHAIIQGMPELLRAFRQLEQEQGFEPLDLAGRSDRYFTWMGLSEFLALWWKLGRGAPV